MKKTDFSNIHKQIDDFIEHCNKEGKPKTIESFCAFIGIHYDTFYKRLEDIPEAYRRLQTLSREDLVNNALTNKYNPTFSIFLAKNNFGMKDKQDLEHSGSVSISQVLSDIDSKGAKK